MKTNIRHSSEHPVWPAYAGEMAARIRAHDWAATPLGAVGSWSVSLRTATGIVLGTRQPALLLWGPDLVCLYNDAYAASLGPGKHPAILGLPARQAGSRVGMSSAPGSSRSIPDDAAALPQNLLAPMLHDQGCEGGVSTCSYSRVEDPTAAGGIGGILALCTETAQALAQRRTEERLAAALRGGRLGIHDFDPRTGLIQWDATAAALWGIPSDRPVTYEEFAAGLHPDDLPRVEALVTRASIRPGRVTPSRPPRRLAPPGNRVLVGQARRG